MSSVHPLSDRGPIRHQPRGSAWIETFTARKFWPLDPSIAEIDIVDIAHALSNICRFNGHCPRFYSVAEHSILVSKVISPKYEMEGLFHDAAEAYICDVTRPIKPCLRGYKAIENRLNLRIIQAFDLCAEPDCVAAVKRADDIMLATEVHVFKFNRDGAWPLDEEPVENPGIIQCLSPREAEEAFWIRLHEIKTNPREEIPF